MIPPRIHHYIQNEKKHLSCMLVSQLASICLYAAAMKVIALVTDYVFLKQHTLREAAPALLVLLFLFTLQEIFIYLQKGRQRQGSLHSRQQIRKELHRHYLRQPQTPTDSSQFVTLACSSTEILDDDWQILLPSVICLMVDIPFLLLVFACSDGLTAIICLLTLPIAPFLLYLLSSLTRKRSSEAWHKLAELTHGFHELICTLPLLKIFRQAETQRKAASQLLQKFSSATLNVLELAFLASFVLELITTLAIALIAVTIGLRILNGELPFATGFFILLLLPEFYRPLRQSGTAFHAAMNANTAAQKIQQATTNADTTLSPGHRETLPIPPAITVRNLSFTYPQRHTPVLQNISLQFPARQITVLTGNSGSGKTTLLTIMAGLYPPTAGEVYLENQRLHTMHPASQHKLIGYLPQQPHLFQGTLAENLLLFQEAPPERCLQALRLAQLEDFFQQLPQGLDTPLGDGGKKISQGQLKRLGLARLILQNNPLLLLDEPTSGLDETTERSVLRTLSVLAKGRTMIISSHHPAVLEMADNHFDLLALQEKEGEPC
ncbi:MAG: thiol reductant ABC exporter subunit CydD [Selenomonas sp.]|uniref:thiol reductant ABC exporter subunit CydD n=1 Tax=Selenomonas sp. TaxID=2053611 RepID=UPI0025CE31A1|nr:thiol reductant ABC exporter subunit CydD [Selenomonas sp.]MCR5756801.1 thiol reductant ABC exporter subunit CydD [Selenomonas sp.]